MKEIIKNKFIWVVALATVIILGYILGTQWAASYYFKQGQDQFQRGNFQESRARFTRSLTFNSRNPLTHAYLGRIALGIPRPGQEEYYPEANFSETINHYEKAISLGLEQKSRSFHARALEDTGFAYWNLERHDAENQKYLEKIEKYPQASFWARYFVAKNYFHRFNKPREALDFLLAAPNAVDAESSFLYRIYALTARLYLYFGDYENVERYAKLAISNALGRKDFNVQIAHALLAQVYGIKKDFGVAENEIKIANDLAGNQSTYECALARAYLEGGNYARAIAVAEKADKTQPVFSYSVCLAVLGKSYLARGETGEAQKYFRQYLDLTNRMEEKNIVVIREREEIQKKLAE